MQIWIREIQAKNRPKTGFGRVLGSIWGGFGTLWALFGRSWVLWAPFFGIQAATLVATSRLAKLGRAKPVGIAHYRDPITHRYRIVLTPVDDAFPTGNDQKDAAIINTMLEKAIRVQPEQYMWVHRRFKTRPEGEPSLY